MEEDRAVADLGPDIVTELDSEEVIEDKKPKRRFIGRKAADAKVAARQAAEQANGNIEESAGNDGTSASSSRQGASSPHPRSNAPNAAALYHGHRLTCLMSQYNLVLVAQLAAL